MSYGRTIEGSRCTVRKVRVTDKTTGVIRDTFNVVVQCGKGRKRAEQVRVAINEFLRRGCDEAPIITDIRRVLREELAAQTLETAQR